MCWFLLHKKTFFNAILFRADVLFPSMQKSTAILTFLSGLFFSHTAIAQQGLLWRVTGHGHSSFVFGTMHTSDSIANSMDSTVFNAMHSCKVVLLEGDLAQIPDPMRMTELMRLPQGVWTGLYTPEQRAEIDTYLEDKLSPIAQLMKEELCPIFVLFMVQQAEEMQRVNADQETLMNEAMDMRFQRLADAHGLATHGLEAWDEQMQSVSGIPMETQVQLLLESARGKQFSHVITTDIIDHYYSQNLTAMGAMMDQNDPLQSVFLEAVLYKRNDRFVQRAVPHFESGPTFMAVGALHLAGDRGVLAQFRQLGYTVEPVPFSFLNYHSSN